MFPSKKQIQYAEKISKTLGLDMPDTTDLRSVNEFINTYKKAFYEKTDREIYEKIAREIQITDYAQEQLGDIVFVDIPTVGETLEAGETFGTIEVVKTISDLFLPLAGEILEQNEALEENPELVNKDPYGEGWLIKMKPADVKAAEDLLDAEAYKAVING